MRTGSEGLGPDRVRALADTLPELIWTSKPDGNVDYYNQRWVTYTGMPSEPAKNCDWKDAIHPADLPQCVERWTKSIATERDFEFEVRIKRALDGAYRWHIARAVPERDQNGVVTGWVGSCTDIEELRTSTGAEKSLGCQQERAEELFQVVVEAAPSAMIMVGADGRITFVNTQTEALFGYQRKELLGQSIGMLVPRRNRPAHQGWLSQFFAAPRVRGMGEASDLVGLDKSGKEIPVEIGLTPIRTAQGQFVLASVVDIRGRKEGEKRLRDLATILDRASDAILLRDANDRITYWNQGAQKLYGWSKAEALGQISHQLLATRYPQPLAEIQSLLMAQGSWNGELVHTNFKGAPITVASTWTLQRDESTDSVSVLEMDYDLTARKETENQLRSLSQRLGLATSAMQAGIWDWDIRSNDVEWDERMREMYGAPKDKKVTYKDWARAVLPEDLPRVEAMVQQTIAAKAQDLIDFRIRLPNGQIRHIQAAMRTVADEAGEVIRTVGVNLDISNHKQAEQQIRDLNAALEARVAELKTSADALTQRSEALVRSNRALEEFAYVASHDLQEPLRGVSGCIQLLQKNYGGKLDAKADEFIRHSILNIERMQALILSLLDYTRLEKMGNQFTPVDSGVALRDALANLSVAVQESGAQVTADALPTVVADQGQLMQLFQNLVGNSVKFRGTETPRVHVSAELSEQTNQRWIFRVRDNGIGIDPQHSERIFGVFQRLHPRDRYSGTGIGLAICRRIVERHGGRLWVESTPGQGSTFIFTLGGTNDRGVKS